MTTRIRLEIASATDPGVVRSFNEDSVVIERELGLLVLADGMGGYKAGDIASAMATGLIVDELKLNNQPASLLAKNGEMASTSLAVKSAIEKSNRVIYHTAQTDEKYHGMGTTIVLILFQEAWATIAHVGDSRLYRLRDGVLKLLTHDHTLLQEQVAMGMISTDEARYSHNRNLVTRALGTQAAIEVDVRQVDVLPGDIYLLCSDGLNDMVDDDDIALAMSELQANLPLTATHLVQMANDNGGHDNVSVVIAKVRNDNIQKRSLKDWLLGWLTKA